MAIQWGDWEYSGGNGMRVGIEFSWENPAHGDSSVDCSIDIYTQNQFSYSDSQALNYNSYLANNLEAHDGKSFTNSQGSSATLRDSVTYRYNYGGSSYGSSPGSRTFTATISGAFNGVTPSASVTTNIPARPYASPAAPTSPSVTRLGDTQQRVNWVNQNTAGEPYSSLTIQRAIGAGSFFELAAGIGVTTQYIDSTTVANQKYSYKVRSNLTGFASSAYTSAVTVWTAPGTPTITTTLTNITGPPVGKRINWSNTTSYSEYQTVVVAYKDGVDQGAIAVLSAGVTSFDHLTTHATRPYTTTNKWKYYTYAQTTSGALIYSGASGWTEETTGTTLPPLAPTNLTPNGSTVDPTIAQNLTWTHNPQSPDTSLQSKYALRHRLSGSGSWTNVGPTTSGTSQYSLPSNTYSSGQSMEWQVATYGTDPAQGAWSASATVNFTSATAKLPIYMDIYTGDWEASTTAYIARYQDATTIVAATLPSALPVADSVQFLTAAQSSSGGWPWGAVAGFLKTSTFVDSGTKYATQDFTPANGTTGKNFRTGSGGTWGSWWDSYWVAPTLTGSWSNFGSGWQVAQYRRQGSRLHLRGLIAGGSFGVACMTVPTGFRPSSNQMFQSATTAGLTVSSTGTAGLVAPDSGTPDPTNATGGNSNNTSAQSAGTAHTHTLNGHTHGMSNHTHSLGHSHPSVSVSGTTPATGSRLDGYPDGTIVPQTGNSGYYWLSGYIDLD